MEFLCVQDNVFNHKDAMVGPINILFHERTCFHLYKRNPRCVPLAPSTLKCPKNGDGTPNFPIALLRFQCRNCYLYFLQLSYLEIIGNLPSGGDLAAIRVNQVPLTLLDKTDEHGSSSLMCLNDIFKTSKEDSTRFLDLEANCQCIKAVLKGSASYQQRLHPRGPELD